MPADTHARVRALYRYPVKGLSGEPLPAVELGAHQTFPMDRAFAFENGPSGFDAAAPAWRPKVKFLCLMRNARLASLSSRYDDASQTLTIEYGKQKSLKANLASENGRRAAEDFFTEFMREEKRGPLRLLQAPNHSFSDLAKKVVSLINLETLAALENRLGQPVHPLRFRANLYFDGLPAWSEFDLVGKEIGIGTARLKILKRTERCAATDVNPETALRDLAVPKILMQLNDNMDLGIYAEVRAAGKIAKGDAIEIPL